MVRCTIHDTLSVLLKSNSGTINGSIEMLATTNEHMFVTIYMYYRPKVTGLAHSKLYLCVVTTSEYIWEKVSIFVCGSTLAQDSCKSASPEGSIRTDIYTHTYPTFAYAYKGVKAIKAFVLAAIALGRHRDADTTSQI